MPKIIIFVLVASITVISQIFLKKGMRLIGNINILNFQDFLAFIGKLIQNKYIIIGLFLSGISAFIWLIVISKIDLTSAFPVTSGLFYVILFFSSWAFLGESITLVKIFGVASIIFGIFLISK